MGGGGMRQHILVLQDSFVEEEEMFSALSASSI